jgi:TolB-like protein
VLVVLLAQQFRGKVANGNSSDSTVIAAQSQKSIAVLPFLDLTEGMKEEEFADGMTEELIDKLSKIPGLRVPAPTSSFYFKGKQIPVTEMAKTLGVVFVLDGSVRKSGGRVRVAARLIRADNGFVIWSETYDRPFGDILTDRRHHSISQARHGGDVRRLLGIVAEQPAQRCYGLVDGILADGDVSPDLIQQLIDAEDFTCVLGEAKQQAHRAGLDSSGLSVARNLARCRIHAPLADAKFCRSWKVHAGSISWLCSQSARLRRLYQRRAGRAAAFQNYSECFRTSSGLPVRDRSTLVGR